MNARPAVLFSAAHAEFPDTEPLGGGKAVADYLIREWRAAAPFPLEVLSPASGLSPAPSSMPKAQCLAQLSERQYARFCRAFERRVTQRVFEHDPARCVVLSNDISEGPDFAALSRRGYRVVTIFHVDVVDYFTKFYLRGWVRPERLTTWGSYRWLPDVLRLVFEKQRDCVAHSARIIVPSAPMKELIGRCYPWRAPEGIAVLPWGNVAENAECRMPNAESPIPGGQLPIADAQCPMPAASQKDFVILTLSRLSPEKGIERLLTALRLVHAPVRVWICGAAAYMQGRRYERRLRRLADDRVEFLGHVTGARKAALLRRADLFVSPSRHESYGLAIAEAEAAGCRVISHFHHGARGLVIDCGNPRALAAAIAAMAAQGRMEKPPAQAQKSDAAGKLAELLREVGLDRIDGIH